MAIVYRSNGPWGSGTGANLTAAQIDGNFYDHETRIATLEASSEEVRSIASVVQSGALITINYTDGTSDSFELPTSAWSARGEWTVSTLYNPNDLVSVDGLGLYLVLDQHISGSSFDANATESNGALYELLFADNRAADVETESGTTLIPSIAYAGKYVRCTSGAPVLVTIPAGVFRVRDEIHFRQCDLGVIEFRAGDGVTINTMSGFEMETSGVGAVATIKCVDGNTFDLFGLLAEARSA